MKTRRPSRGNPLAGEVNGVGIGVILLTVVQSTISLYLSIGVATRRAPADSINSRSRFSRPRTPR